MLVDVNTRSKQEEHGSLPLTTRARTAKWGIRINRRRGAAGSRTAVRLMEWVSDFQPFRINNLEMADQNSASLNPLLSWLRSVDALRSAA
jgi:hypothetical protein